MKLFTNDLEATFTCRPNRFIVHCDAEGTHIRAHCPNPGRLAEILLPGVRLILQKAKDPGRKTPYTLVGVYYRDKIIPLYSGKSNDLYEELILPLAHPDAKEYRREYTHGRSRFDFMISTGTGQLFVEVKACTLVEEKTAMFPDAPSARALKHLTELAELEAPQRGEICFVVNHNDAERFIPNMHTDPELYTALYQHKDKLAIRAVSVSLDPDGTACLVNPSVPIEFPLSIDTLNSGIYLLVIALAEDATVNVGALGMIHFKAGYYIYCGSAKKDLRQRIARHKRKNKTLKWHVDYLIAASKDVEAFPVVTEHDLECTLSNDVAGLAEKSVQKFGSSDCGCASHLHYFKDDPMTNRAFVDLIFHYRHIRAF